MSLHEDSFLTITTTTTTTPPPSSMTTSTAAQDHRPSMEEISSLMIASEPTIEESSGQNHHSLLRHSLTSSDHSKSDGSSDHDALLKDYVIVEHQNRPSISSSSSSSLFNDDSSFLIISSNAVNHDENNTEQFQAASLPTTNLSSLAARNSMEVHRKRTTVTLKRPPLSIDGIDLASYGGLNADDGTSNLLTTPTSSSSSSSLSTKKPTGMSSSQQQYIEVKRAQATREYKQNLLNQTSVPVLQDSHTMHEDIVEPKEIIFLDNFEYALIPDDVPYSDPLFLSQVERLKQIIEREYSEVGALAQFKRDAILWRKTLESPEYEALGNVLRRIFCVLRYGGLLYREDEKTHEWNIWHSTKYPIASVLSHGSRVIIQLDSMDGEGATHHNGDEHSFWKWLITGSCDGDLSKYVSTYTSGNEARVEGKIIFRRMGATHALDYYKPHASDQPLLDSLQQLNGEITNITEKYLNEDELVVQARQRRIQKEISRGKDDLVTNASFMSSTSSAQSKIIIDDRYDFTLPYGKKKVLHETKTIGITFRDTKLFGTTDALLKHHRHWGMNLPMGGAENRSLTGKKIEANGEHGHMYLYYQSPKKGRFGGLLIGVEGSEYGKYDQCGGYHSLSAKSPHFSPTFGYKWRAKRDAPDLRDVSSPDKYNSLLIDLTGGWRHLIDKFNNEWDDDYVSRPALP
ncbi:hypothetical protein C9374_013952 [Naegleria lovaniensis]|uniref:Novel toxin 11 domain-containing protein n=1 Tax=Naegleria lovaniensis TaxID=51637 RepID=A0AA88GV05_NAELO|nr:uncharacterized protein C9374_013952 [Naegleria lovaniensis]KAG2389392.1 hypothetical protein C9374_013952 [Naegleria lovaniensis]